MASYDYDVVVIGSGAGGSIAAQQIAKSGKSVALVEAGALGGQVLNHSCIPTNALLQAAQVFETAKRGAQYGIRSSTVGYNYPSVKAWKDTVQRKTRGAYSPDSYLRQGIGVIEGRAYFIDPHTISIGTARVTGKYFVIATGSELLLPKIPGLSTAGFLTHKEAVNLTRPPKSMIIVGGGESGVEFAQLFAIFGTKVTLVESAGRLIGHEEPEAAQLLAKRLNKEYKMNILLDTQVSAVSTVGLKKKVTLTRKGKSAQVIVDEILLTAGQRAVTDIGLENAGVKYTESQIKTNRYQRTTSAHIFAIGDCAGPYPYTHTAAHQGQIVAHNIVHPKSPVTAKYSAIPRTIFTNPQIAAVGKTEDELSRHGVAFSSVTVPISITAKSATSGFNDGFIKIMANKKTGALLGATIVSPEASEMISQLALAVNYSLTAQQVAHTIHPFGTWSEVVRIACAKLSK